MIKAWSNSRLDTFETCPYRAYLQYIERVPTRELVPPPGKEEHPLIRGIRVHEAAENFVTKDILLIDELQNFNHAFHLQRASYRRVPEYCVVEQEWGIDENWKPTGWFSDTAWGRMKLDYGEIRDTEMDIVDYKTGKKYAPKHTQQAQLYALVASIRYPEVETFHTAFWYLDDPNPKTNTLKRSYSKLQVQMFKEDFDRRARTMTGATEFEPHTSAYACRFCPYGEGHDGNSHCQFRYSFDNK